MLAMQQQRHRFFTLKLEKFMTSDEIWKRNLLKMARNTSILRRLFIWNRSLCKRFNRSIWFWVFAPFISITAICESFSVNNISIISCLQQNWDEKKKIKNEKCHLWICESNEIHLLSRTYLVLTNSWIRSRLSFNRFANLSRSTCILLQTSWQFVQRDAFCWMIWSFCSNFNTYNGWQRKMC